MNESFPDPPTSRVSTFVSWLIIVGACVAMVFLQREMVNTRQDIGPNDAQRENVMLRMTSRYAVGAARIASSLSPTPGANEDLESQFAAQLDMEAARPVDRTRVAIIIGELAGKDAALERLDAMGVVGGDQSTARDVALLRTIYNDGPRALDERQREALIERHHWYGQLALTHGLPPNDPQRRDAVAPAMRTVISAVVFVLAALLAGMLGFVLLIVGIVMLATGKLKRQGADHAPGQPRHPALLETVAIFLVGLIGVSMLTAAIEQRFDFDATGLTIWLLPLVFFWPRLRGMSGGDLRAALGWHRGKGVFIEALCGVMGHFAGLPLLAVGLVFVIVFASFGYEAAHHPMIDELFGAGWADIVLLYILACVWAPLVEESLFRGAFYHHLRRPIGAVLAAAVTGFLFAVIHPQGVVAVPVLMSLGFTFAMIREWRGSLIGPMAAHAFNNLVAVTLMLLLLGG
jgi:membrane protease YdiL (CAAX protease family)